MNKIQLRIYELGLLIKFYFAKFVSLFIKSDGFWLISERGKEARDNAYFFYNYIKKNHPEVKVKYVISKDSEDLARIEDLSDVVNFASFSHYLALCKASHLISTHIMGYTPDHYIFSLFDRYFNLFAKQKKVFLQHGIIKDNICALHAENVNLDLFICGAKGEFDYVYNTFHYPRGIVQYTGLCRYDNLNSFNSKKQILIMPTWRSYIDKNHFEDSEYYKVYSELLTSPLLEKITHKYGYEVIFYPHFEVHSNLSSFKKLNLSFNIKIAGFEYDVQTLLKESALLITDYSSVYFDMAYMKKRILLYQFDKNKYHYKPGYFDVSDIGYVTSSLNELLSHLEDSLKNNCKMDSKKTDFVDQFFSYCDDKNCERVYNAINEL